MKITFILSIAAAMLIAVSAEEKGKEHEGARLLVQKHVHNKYLVENMDVIVKVFIIMFFISFIYTIHSTGNSIPIKIIDTYSNYNNFL